MSRDYNDLTALVQAASKQDCSVHLHVNDQGRNVFSVGNGNVGAREFGCYFDALQFITDRSNTAADCAEQAGGLIATNCLNDILNAPSQAESMATLQTALIDLQRLPHPKRAAGGFAVALLPVLEVGLKNLPKVTP